MWRRRVRQSSDSGTNLSADRDIHINIGSDPATNPESPVPEIAPNPFTQLTGRFRQVYEWQGIYPAEIPDFLEQTDGPRVTLNDLSNDENLLNRLDGPLLDFTTEIFALDRNWLRQGSDRVLRCRDFYKNVESLADFLLVESVYRSDRKNLWTGGRFGGCGRMYFFTEEPSFLPSFSAEWPSIEKFESQEIEVGAIFEVPIVEFRGRLVCRYYALHALPWHYWRSHFQLVAMMAVAYACGVSVVGRYLSSKDEVIDLCDGRRFPVELAKDRWTRRQWSPKYPYIGEHAWSEDESYLRKWSSYLAYFEEEEYPRTISDAKEHQWEVLLNNGR
jgi:hypothetical protein